MSFDVNQLLMLFTYLDYLLRITIGGRVQKKTLIKVKGPPFAIGRLGGAMFCNPHTLKTSAEVTYPQRLCNRAGKP